VAWLDIASCFPLVAHLIGWWDLTCAHGVEQVDSTARAIELCEQVRADPTVAFDSRLWREMGCTLVQVVPRGETWPVVVDDDRRPDGRMGVTTVESRDCAWAYRAWPDVVHAAIDARGPLRILRATTLRPLGRQESIRPSLDVLPELRLDLREDPVVALVAYRRKVEAAGDRVLAGVLRIMVSSLVFGNFARFDPVRVKVDGTWVNSERPGPWICIPIAATVTAGSRLLLGLLDRLVRDLGGVVLYRDTDSSLIPATSCGGEAVFPRKVSPRCLSWAEIEGIIAAFAPLSPAPDWPVWSIKRGMCRG
jgi:hypothetical protein